MSNIRLTRALFYETAEDKSFCLYTLKDHDHKGYKSLYKLYMETDDLTEYYFSQNYLDGWEHWKILKESTWFKPYAERWYEELSIRAKSEALANIKRDATTDSKSSAQSRKFIVEGGWESKDQKKENVGRPTKDRIRQQAEEMFNNAIDVEEDLQRLRENNKVN